MKDDDDAGSIGFYPNTKKRDLRFLIHTVNNVESLQKVEDLSDVSQDIVLSLSFISPNQKGSYYNNGFGVSLEANIPDIVNAYHVNQGSGNTKNRERLIDLKTSEYYKEYRNFIPNNIKKLLKLNEEEYIALYNILSEKKHLTQIQDDDIFNLSVNKSIYGIEIKEAIIKAQDKLLRDSYQHNEVVGSYLKVNAFVAKKDSIKDIPAEYLNFVQQFDIPIILLGT